MPPSISTVCTEVVILRTHFVHCALAGGPKAEGKERRQKNTQESVRGSTREAVQALQHQLQELLRCDCSSGSDTVALVTASSSLGLIPSTRLREHLLGVLSDLCGRVVGLIPWDHFEVLGCLQRVCK